MFKKSLMFFGFVLCCANMAYGDCVFTEPTDSSPSDEDIFLTDPQNYKNGKPDALICGSNNCARNTYVYIRYSHWIGSETHITGTPIYTCETFGNDKWQRVGNAPDCTADADKTNEIYIDTQKIKNKKYYYQTEIEPGVYVGLCAEPDTNNGANEEDKYDLKATIQGGGYLEPVSLIPFSEPQVFDLPADDKIKGEGTTGFACTPERQGNYYVFDDRVSYYKCDLNSSWKKEGLVRPCYTINEWTGIDLPAPSGLTEIPNDNNNYKIYKKTDINPVNGYTGVYEYSDNIKDMCQWCRSGLYGVPTNTNGTDVFCPQNEQRAWCEFAKIKNNANVDWDIENNKCKCIDDDADKEWDEIEHVCKPKSESEENSESEEQQYDKKCGVPCNAENAELSIICTENGFARNFVCSDTSHDWYEQDPEINNDNWCAAGNDKVFEISDKTNMSEIKWKAASEKTSIYINTGSATQKGSGYKTDFDADHKVMCFDCPVGWYAFDNETGRHCFETEESAKCAFTGKSDENCKAEEEENKKKFEDAKKVVDEFFREASKNADKWKTADGKFNTARLASDLTAGVVLGTVGGVVSGVVIKKKQLEKGFEVLHCAIGGQSVADWGDTFTIGFTR